MNKRLIKINIVMWSIILVLLMTFLIYEITTGKGTNQIFSFSRWNITSGKVQKEEKVSIDNCENIKLVFSSADIEVVTSAESSLKVVEEGSGNLTEAEKFTLTKDGNTIEIKDGNSNLSFKIFGFGRLGKKIKLFLPKGYDKDLEIKSTSGNVVFDSGINVKNLRCTQSSGNFSNSSDIIANQIDLKVSSGNINVNNLDVKSYGISATSGNIHIKSISGSGQVDATSGNIEINYKEIDEESSVQTTSGNVKLFVLKGISFEFDGQCVSGDISSSFDLNYKNKRGNEATAKVGEAPYKKINARVTSGNIKISEVR